MVTFLVTYSDRDFDRSTCCVTHTCTRIWEVWGPLQSISCQGGVNQHMFTACVIYGIHTNAVQCAFDCQARRTHSGIFDRGFVEELSFLFTSRATRQLSRSEHAIVLGRSGFFLSYGCEAERLRCRWPCGLQHRLVTQHVIVHPMKHGQQQSRRGYLLLQLWATSVAQILCNGIKILFIELSNANLNVQ